MRPPEEVRRDLIRQWLSKADGDLDAARILLFEDRSFLNIVGFHCQQAAEKYLKAFLTDRQVDFPKTHNLGELLDLIERVDEPLADSLRSITILNPYGVETRYPGDAPDPSRAEAEVALGLAEKARGAILGALNLPPGV
jgi:HEPN domain-containing protein